MKLTTINNQTRDGQLVVVNRAGNRAVTVPQIAQTMQQALDNWDSVAPQLNTVYQHLNDEGLNDAFDLNLDEVMAPLPRALQFLDGSAYLAHVERVRRARGAEMPPSFLEDPLMYQAVSDGFLAHNQDIEVVSEEYGIDFEAEAAVITSDVPMNVSAEEAGQYIQLVCILNDVSLRNLIPAELAKGFGFLQSKPRTALSPFFVTPDELGEAWQNNKIHLPMRTWLNGEWFGEPNCGVDMQFDFAQLVAHAAKTRPLCAGAIIGSGTIANHDMAKGSTCLAEKRVLEVIEHGKPSTPFMSFGDDVKIEITDGEGHNIFGTIHQKVVKY
ncbi:fumarylacetoacetate hydrolase family protein [Marinicella litoralis]|uniref:Fumarylacetoacetate (FAA) hydrolase n=1 Tax=Marinicella litoralis TaxID=644220 RepID=A0A4R6XWL0_9GAMM|nr:fumarylacetoacetate hydrolase family protein [Marinicella litoralis]TDR22634.1 fumarylacetoacetate (FAA) hydrolase [Marinicella litoralis]